MRLTEEQENYLEDSYMPEDIIEILLDNEVIDIWHIIESFNEVIAENYELF